MDIFSRYQLVTPPQGPALLLEGDWPAGEESGDRYSLDESIDARHAWIDEVASALAEQAGDSTTISLAYINALALRYYLVKLLRPIAFFDQLEFSFDSVRMHVTRQRDEDYADVLGQLCRQRKVPYQVHWHNGPLPQLHPMFSNGRVRRLASGWNARRPYQPSSENRVLLCGNPAVLEPICRELQSRTCCAAWLYDRFAFGAWLRGSRQLTCDGACDPDRIIDHACNQLRFHGIDLAPAITRWLACRDHYSRQVDHVQRHLNVWRPECLILDEDATPLKRIAVWFARQAGIPSCVVQHGAPRVRFGFAPLAADRFLAWGESSKEQLAAWGVPRERIVAAGSPRGRAAQPRRPRSRKRPEILLFATTPPRDDRPDAVEYHLTTRTHDDCLRMALLAVAQLPSARLTVKLHPRCSNATGIVRLMHEFSGLTCRVVCRGSVDRWLRRADVVLNCGSSAGIEAAYSGLPVIELLPAGSRDLTPATEWGLFGSARTVEELSFHLARALSAQRLTGRSSVFATTGQSAARSIAMEVA